MWVGDRVIVRELIGGAMGRGRGDAKKMLFCVRAILAGTPNNYNNHNNNTMTTESAAVIAFS